MKKQRTPAGSHKATPLAAEAIRQLLKAKAQQALLKRRVAMLRCIIEREGCGSAHGYRTYLSVRSGYTYTKQVTVKASTQVMLVPIAK